MRKRWCSRPEAESVDFDTFNARFRLWLRCPPLSGLASYSRNFARQPHKTLGTLPRSPDTTLTLAHSRRARGVWKSQKSSFHPLSEGVAGTHSCAHPTNDAAPMWERIAAQLTLLNHLHLAAFIPILLVTYLHRSELLALKTKDLVPPFATAPVSVGRNRSFRNCSVLQRGVRDGLVLINERRLHRVKTC